MDRIPERLDSKFRYVLVSACRAEQLMHGAPPKVIPGDDKATQVALREIQQDLVDWEMGRAPEPEPAAAAAAPEPETPEESS